jgi:hypothetical protein
LQNPLPGRRGNIGQNTIESPGVRQFDANISKTVKISEGTIKSLQLRIDCTNILNHPTAAAPNLNINTANFGTTAGTGAFGGKTGNRQFQGQVRLNF